MKYQQKTFTLPAAPQKVTQAEWERIFGKRDNGKAQKKDRPGVN